MVKEFKDFDKKYAVYKGQYLLYETENGVCCDELQTLIKVYKGCEYNGNYWRRDKKDSNEEIRDAVYFEQFAEDWQKFRVSLKGFDTRIKLARLNFRYNYVFRLYSNNEMSFIQLEIELLRIRNYMGALVRGGQLAADGKIIR